METIWRVENDDMQYGTKVAAKALEALITLAPLGTVSLYRVDDDGDMLVLKCYSPAEDKE